MITITPYTAPSCSDALVHDVRADDVLDAHAQLRRLVEQAVVVDERHADPRGNRNAVVGARPAEGGVTVAGAGFARLAGLSSSESDEAISSGASGLPVPPTMRGGSSASTSMTSGSGSGEAIL